MIREKECLLKYMSGKVANQDSSFYIAGVIEAYMQAHQLSRTDLIIRFLVSQP
jgi:hypothetical protein